MSLACRDGIENSCNTVEWQQVFCSFVVYYVFFWVLLPAPKTVPLLGWMGNSIFSSEESQMTTTKIKHLSSLQEDLKNNVQFRSGVQQNEFQRHLWFPLLLTANISLRGQKQPPIIPLYFHYWTATRTTVRTARATQLTLYHQWLGKILAVFRNVESLRISKIIEFNH